MKTTVSVLLIMITMVVLVPAQSQNHFPMLRERINQAKLREIRVRLDLNEGTFQKFRPIYLRFEDEISGLDLQKLSGLMRINADSLSQEQADLMITNQMEVAKKLIAIREKYYREFRTVLNPRQIIKLYQTEAELRRKVMAELKRRMLAR